jgi:hypothetical protein
VHYDSATAALGLFKWRKVPSLLLMLGGLIAVFGAIFCPRQIAFSWLLAFMFFLSLWLGVLFLVL